MSHSKKRVMQVQATRMKPGTAAVVAVKHAERLLFLSTDLNYLGSHNQSRRVKTQSNSTRPKLPHAAYKSKFPSSPWVPKSFASNCSITFQPPSNLPFLVKNTSTFKAGLNCGDTLYSGGDSGKENDIPSPTVSPIWKAEVKSLPPQVSFTYLRPSSPCTARLPRSQPGSLQVGYGTAQ